MGNTFFFAWEVTVSEWLQSFESDWVTAIAKFFTLFGDEYLLILFLGTVYWCVNKRLGRSLATGVAGGMIFGSLLKGLTMRRRPYMDHPSIKCIRASHLNYDPMSPLLQGYSMPSLHATMTSALFGTLAWNVKKRVVTLITVFMVFFIGLSRVYLGLHYSTDVLSGWVLGTLSLFLFSAIERRYSYKVSFAAILAVGAAGFFYCRDNEFYTLYGVTLGMYLAFLFEEKFVRFDEAKHWWSYIVRPLSGLLVFYFCNALLKKAVAGVTLESTSRIMLFYRLFRYALSTMLTLGVYPMLFKLSHIKWED